MKIYNLINSSNIIYNHVNIYLLIQLLFPLAPMFFSSILFFDLIKMLEYLRL